MISTKFTFNGITSETMGVSLIRLNSGMFNIPFIAGRDILEEYPSNAKAPYFYGIKNQQYTIPMTFSTLSNNMTAANLKTIAAWLIKDDYKPFISDDNPDKIFYLMATNQSDFSTNGNNEGYFELQFKSKFPYALTTSTTPTYDYSSNTGTPTFQITSLSNVGTYYYPEIEITCSNATPATITLTNLSDSSRATSFTGLTSGETVYMDNGKKQIISSVGGNIRYNAFNKNWFRLVQGVNNIQVTGKCVITFRMQFPVFT